MDSGSLSDDSSVCESSTYTIVCFLPPCATLRLAFGSTFSLTAATFFGRPIGFLLAALNSLSFARLTASASLAFSKAAFCFCVRGFRAGAGFSKFSNGSVGSSSVSSAVETFSSIVSSVFVSILF